jgi:signal transduction histidine kinase
VALGSFWPVVRRNLVRATVTRLLFDAAAWPPGTPLEEALAAALGDPSLRIHYRLSNGGFVDSAGAPSPPLGGTTTRIMRENELIAVLSHRPRLLDAPGVAEEVTRVARLALDNERLRAEARARLVDLAASRSRVVDMAEDERRRLERDLHDGAQQKLVALALEIQLATLQLDPDDAATRHQLEQARSETTAALAELRQVARGLYPRELADEGLGAGLDALADTSGATIDVRSMPERRLPAQIESAAYFVIASCSRTPDAREVAVTIVDEEQRIVVEVEADVLPPDLTRLRDRVGALNGSVVVEGGAAAALRVELPCGS